LGGFRNFRNETVQKHDWGIRGFESIPGKKLSDGFFKIVMGCRPATSSQEINWHGSASEQVIYETGKIGDVDSVAAIGTPLFKWLRGRSTLKQIVGKIN